MSAESPLHPIAARLFPFSLASSYVHAWGSAVFGHFGLSQFEHVCTAFWLCSGAAACVLALVYLASKAGMSP